MNKYSVTFELTKYENIDVRAEDTLEAEDVAFALLDKRGYDDVNIIEVEEVLS